MKALKMRLTGKPDRNGHDYYFTTTRVPVSIDLSNSVIHFYPDETKRADGTIEIGGDLVIRHYDKRDPVSVAPVQAPIKAADVASVDSEEEDTAEYED